MQKQRHDGPRFAGQLDGDLGAVVNDAQRLCDGKVAYQQQFGLQRIDTAGAGDAAIPGSED